jgi:hypothetical protein
MAKDVKTRIAERTRLAEFYRKDQNMLGRAVSGTGLAVANTWDRVSAPFKHDHAIFGSTTTYGVIRGAIIGGIIGIVALAEMGVVALPFFFAAATVGAVIAGARYGQNALERHWNKKNHQFADTVAEISGAVPTPGHARSDEKALKPAKQEPLPVQKPETIHSFTKREDMRRADGPAALQR